MDSSVLAGKLATSIASVEDFREHAKFHYDRNAGAVEGVWTWAMGLNYHEVKVSYPITVTDLPAHYDVTLGCPKALFERKVDMSLFGIPTWNNERIGTRASEACQLATITLIDPIQGEVDTPYNDVSVFANFKRKLAPVPESRWRAYREEHTVTALDIEKAQRFIVPGSSTEMIASIAVYPYRNGSKVQYAFAYPYILKGDGSNTYDRAEVEAIKKHIAAIAND